MSFTKVDEWNERTLAGWALKHYKINCKFCDRPIIIALLRHPNGGSFWQPLELDEDGVLLHSPTYQDFALHRCDEYEESQKHE
jgi:hypothetical protein